MNLKDKIGDYPNFPKKGILFRDFSPILGDPSALSFMVEEFSKKFHPNDVDVFAGIESRGFIIACALALKYNKGMILVRKAGKLPGKIVKASYTLEYGKATLEVQKDAIQEVRKIWEAGYLPRFYAILKGKGDTRAKPAVINVLGRLPTFTYSKIKYPQVYIFVMQF